MAGTSGFAKPFAANGCVARAGDRVSVLSWPPGHALFPDGQPVSLAHFDCRQRDGDWFDGVPALAAAPGTAWDFRPGGPRGRDQATAPSSWPGSGRLDQIAAHSCRLA